MPCSLRGTGREGAASASLFATVGRRPPGAGTSTSAPIFGDAQFPWEVKAVERLKLKGIPRFCRPFVLRDLGNCSLTASVLGCVRLDSRAMAQKLGSSIALLGGAATPPAQVLNGVDLCMRAQHVKVVLNSHPRTLLLTEHCVAPLSSSQSVPWSAGSFELASSGAVIEGKSGSPLHPSMRQCRQPGIVWHVAANAVCCGVP